MEEKELKTSPKQRFFIILIAVIMLGSMIASYAAIVLNNGGSGDGSGNESSEISEEKKAEYEQDYKKKAAEFSEMTKSDFDKFIQYKSEIAGYNETSANENGLKSRDLLAGSGEEVKEDGTNYLAYYVGWCADESIFDSSFDDSENPTGFSRALDPSMGLIEGWTQGVKGMKIGGIRKITIPGELAYGDSMEICGGTNKPLKFIVMAVEKTDSLAKLSEELEEASMRYQYSQYGIDYNNYASGSN